MTRSLRLRSAVVIALLMLGLTIAPVVAHASPFASYRSAAADEYQGNSGSGAGNGNGSGTNGGNGSGNVQKGKSSSRRHSSGVNGQSASGNASSGASGANLGVARSTHPITTKGTLPFTGLDLTVLVLVALGLLGAGLSLRAAERLKSRRRANASS
jgi:hypothetical protein